jgi:FkbM family methyltransferase
MNFVLIDSNIIKSCYDNLEDELSKKLFTSVFLYNVTERNEFKRDIVSNFDYTLVNDICTKVKLNKKLFIYGIGKKNDVFYFGKQFVSLFSDLVYKVVDKNFESIKTVKTKWTDEIFNVESPYEIEKVASEAVVLVSMPNTIYQNEVLKQLISFGVSPENIVFNNKYNEVNDKNTYFCHPFLNFSEFEYYVDCGSYDGETCISFSSAVEQQHKNISKIFAFEASPQNFYKTKLALKDTCAVIYNNAVYDKNETVCFSVGENSLGDLISVEGNCFVEAVRLDDVLANEKITTIKFDVEGAELCALRGCEVLIRKNRPKLLISAYHKPEDIYILQEYVYNLNLNYKFYLRHNSYLAGDTILFAIPSED